MFAKLWNGTIIGTLKLCAEQGMVIHRDTAAGYLRDPRFIDIMREEQAHKPGSGIWTIDELKRFLTRVAAGIEPDGYDTICVAIPIVPGDADYDFEQGGSQFRREFHQVEKPSKMRDRTKASDILGRTLGAFVDRVEITGDLKVSVTDLLDDDLRQVIDVTPSSEQPVLTDAHESKALSEGIAHNARCTQSVELIESIL